MTFVVTFLHHMTWVVTCPRPLCCVVTCFQHLTCLVTCPTPPDVRGDLSQPSNLCYDFFLPSDVRCDLSPTT